MAGKARFGRLAGIDDRALAAASLDVETAGTMAGLATRAAELWVRGECNPGMAGRAEMIGLVGMTFGARFAADVLGSSNGRRSQDRAVDSHTSD